MNADNCWLSLSLHSINGPGNWPLSSIIGAMDPIGICAPDPAPSIDKSHSPLQKARYKDSKWGTICISHVNWLSLSMVLVGEGRRRKDSGRARAKSVSKC